MNLNQNISPEEFEQIERYLLLQMSAAERQTFEAEMIANKDLEDKVQQVQLLMLGVQEAALSRTLNRFHTEMPVVEKKEQKTTKLFATKRWLAAASVIIIVALGCWFFLFRKSENEKLYATYFSPDPGLMTTMGTTENYAFDRAMVDYKTGQYTEAITAWKSLLQSNPQSDTLNYFIGTASLANNSADSAIIYLEKVTAIPQSYFVQEAYWYLGMAYLKEGKNEAAMAAVRKSNHPQKEELLKTLNQ